MPDATPKKNYTYIIKTVTSLTTAKTMWRYYAQNVTVLNMAKMSAFAKEMV